MANVRWKDKANLPGAQIADDDYIPITDLSDTNTDKHITPLDLSVYINSEIADDTATLTNKTIDSDNNTITNIVNADIKAAAAIAVNKLAALTASRVVVTDGSGFISADGTTTAELQKLDGCTSTTAELNFLDADSNESVFADSGAVVVRASSANQIKVTDGTIEPVTDDDIDLGSSTKEFKNGYFDGTVICDGLTCAGTASLTGALTHSSGAVILNAAQADYDTNIRGDTDADLFYVDASADMVGFSTQSPAATVDVDGTLAVRGVTTLGAFNYGASAEGSDAYIISLTPTMTTLAAGTIILLKPDVNNTGACTLKVDGMVAKDIVLYSGADPANDDIDSRGIAMLVYDGTNFVLMNPA